LKGAKLKQELKNLIDNEKKTLMRSYSPGNSGKIGFHFAVIELNAQESLLFNVIVNVFIPGRKTMSHFCFLDVAYLTFNGISGSFSF